MSRDGVAASRLRLPAGAWTTVLDAMCDRFPQITRAQWQRRMDRGRVLDDHGERINGLTPYRQGAEVRYFREVVDEPVIDARERILHVDEHLIVVDKPHFLPVVPSGRFVTQTLLARLARRFDLDDIVPLHRIDRDTAGLVMLSCNRSSRDAYHALFRERGISKGYEAVAAPLPQLVFPHERHSHIARGQPFFRMCEVADARPNSMTRIDVVERGTHCWKYSLQPLTGRKHQLRVHMAALGAPIDGDRTYPQLQPETDDDAGRPLQLLARTLEFIDPIDGRERRFESLSRLRPLVAGRDCPVPGHTQDSMS